MLTTIISQEDTGDMRTSMNFRGKATIWLPNYQCWPLKKKCVCICNKKNLLNPSLSCTNT